MADAVVDFLVENLLQLLSENVELIAGVEDDFQRLLEEVQRLKAFLDDAAKYHSDGTQWKLLGEEIQKTVHRAEDAIDKFLVQAKLHQEKSKMGRFFDVSHLATVRNLAAEIKGIHEKVKELRENNQQAFQPRPMLELPRKGAQEAAQEEDRIRFITQFENIVCYRRINSEYKGPLEDDKMVGFDEEANKVIKRLVEGSVECRDIVPIVGMPGLGKTTLARKIYNDPKLSYEFFSILWIYVGQNYKLKKIYLNILNGFTKSIDEYQNKDVDELARDIYGFIASGGRCLICLDDVWGTHIIDAVKKVFPENVKGHRIMITTRDISLARYANPNPHVLKFLTPKESFELLVKIVFGKGSCPNDLVELGERIARECGGVPLALVVIAGALRGRSNIHDWIKMENYVTQHLLNDHEGCLKFVEMSYYLCPQEMRTCFLYCGVFPRGFDIPCWKLIRLWIAEGLIKPQQNYSLEEIAEFYLNDLVNRNLVILQKKSDGQIKTCRLHDMLHYFCRKEASNKWLFQEVSLTPDQAIPMADPNKSRRLCIQPSNLKDFLSKKPSAEHVRSFYCFSSKEKQISGLTPNDIKLIHKAFPLVRVLDVESLKFLFSKDFNQLFHLRYIAISGNFNAIPLTFGKFWNLQTLIFNTSTSASTLEVKADIWNMLQLRHLHTNIPAKLPSPTTTASGKPSCLQTLSMVAPESCKKDVLAKARHITKLSIRGQMAVFLETKGGINNLEELKCLKHLKLLNDAPYMNKAYHLPPALFGVLRTLRKLILANTRFSWSEATKLGQLESLEVLKLKEDAFIGDSWEPEIGGFSQLQVLWIEKAAELETWEASNLNFPILRLLVLISCDKLNGLPLGLADIPNLQEMRLENTSKAVKSAKDVQESKISKGMKCNLTIFPPQAESKATQ